MQPGYGHNNQHHLTGPSGFRYSHDGDAVRDVGTAGFEQFDVKAIGAGRQDELEQLDFSALFVASNWVKPIPVTPQLPPRKCSRNDGVITRAAIEPLAMDVPRAFVSGTSGIILGD